MNIIIPMAGWGSRMRPHTLTVPKPMISIAGKSIVERLVDNLIKVSVEPIEHIAFIIRADFGKEIEGQLKQIAEFHKTPFSISYQDEPKGTAHAILCAKDHLKGNTIVAFADTIFTAEFKIDTKNDGVIWVQKIPNPEAFGVVKLNEDNQIVGFVEKPNEFVSDLAIIGVYFFNNGENLKDELQFLIDNNVIHKGEYQLTDALENMKNKGLKFYPGQVDEWLDCGNKDATVFTNQRVLEILRKNNELLSSKNHTLDNSTIIEPCFIGENVIVKNSVVGPHVSIESNSVIENSIIKNSMIQSQTKISNKLLHNSMIGSKATIDGKMDDMSVGDFNVIK
jgi:glucose-1-phosphate thymidylyltransferase